MKKAILLTILFVFFFCSCGNQIKKSNEQDYVDIINYTNTFIDEYDNEVFLADYQIASLTEEYIFKPNSYTFIDLNGKETEANTKKYYSEFNKKPDAEWVVYSKNESTVDTSSISIPKVRKALQIPDSADVTYEIGEPFYKESFGEYLAPVKFYENNVLVAGASVFLDSSELGDSIILYDE